MSHHMCSISYGKDSLAMLHILFKLNAPLDEVVFYNTGMEFNAIYHIRNRVRRLLESRHIEYTELGPQYEFEYLMFDKPVNGRNGPHNGYSWCGGLCRWGTTEKLKALDRYAESKDATVYVGLAADEQKRLQKKQKPYKVYPLANLGLTEGQCLKACYNEGYDWMEDGIRLYDILDRVSCWCCGNKNLKELKNIYMFLPRYWNELKRLQSRTCRPMKGVGKSVFELEERFKRELAQAA